jgi:hypothetical protein
MLLRACKSSRYGALTAPLVGYRQERVSIRKSLLGRWHFSRAIWQTAVRDGCPIAGAKAIALQAVKFGYDTLALATRLDRLMLSHRAVCLPAAEADEWRRLWARSLAEISAGHA